MDHKYCSNILINKNMDIDTDTEIEQFEVENLQKGTDELLIDAVRGYPHLYDTSLKDYRNIQMKDNSWKEISLLMNMTVESCQNRWLRLRERFGKEQRLQEIESRSGSGASRRPIFSLYNNMIFLKKYIKRRRSYTNVSNPILERATDVSDKHNIIQESTKNFSSQLISNINRSKPSSTVFSHLYSDDIFEDTEDIPETNYIEYTQKSSKTIETPQNSKRHILQEINRSQQQQTNIPEKINRIEKESTSSLSLDDSSSRDTTPIPLQTELGNITKNVVKKSKNKNITSLESSLATLSNTVQNRLVNLSSEKHNIWNLNNLTADQSFGLLVSTEIEKIPEPEKSIRKQAITNILWKPYT